MNMKDDAVPVGERWDLQPLRIAAMQVASPESDSLPILDKWHELRFNSEQLLHVMGDDYFALYDAERHEQRLTEYISRAHAHGMKIIAYGNLMQVPQVSSEPTDDWLQVGLDGSSDTRACINSPYRDRALKAATGVMDCGADGMFLDGPHIRHDGCYCRYCEARFKEAHGIPLPRSRDDAKVWQIFQDFRRNSMTNFVREMREAVRDRKADGILYLNHFVFTASSGDGQCTHDLLPYMDWIGSEGGFLFYGFPQRAHLWKVGSTAKMLESIAPDKPRVIFIDGANCPWNYIMHTPDETRLMIASTAANAANHWYCFVVGLSDFESDAADAMRHFNIRLEKHEDLYRQTRSAARVGLMWSQDTLEIYDEDAPESDLNLAGVHEGTESDIPLINQPGWTHPDLPSAKRRPLVGFNCAYELLWRSQIPFDIVHDQFTDLEQLSRYDVLVLPNVICMRSEVVDMLHEYVSGGGNLIATFETSLCDEKGRRRDTFALQDVFGVVFDGHLKDFHHYGKMDVPLEGPIGDGLFRSVVPGPRYALVSQATTAEAMIRYYQPCPEYYMPLPELDMPALFHNRFGEGRCYYFNNKFFEKYSHYGFTEYKAIFLNMMDSLTPRQLIVKARSEALEVSLRQQENRLLLHLVNYSGSHKRPMPQTVPLHDLEISIVVPEAPSSVERVFENESLAFEWNEGRVDFVLPQLDTYELIKIELGS